MITTLQFDIQTAEQRQKLQMVLEYVSTIKLPFRKKDGESDAIAVDATMAEQFNTPFFVDLKASIEHIRAVERGEIPHGQSLSELLDELDAEYELEKNVLENAH